MKILIVKSKDTTAIPGFFETKYGGEFANRKFIPHITDNTDLNFCNERCMAFRKNYNLNHSNHIEDILEFPAVLPELLDNPEDYIPDLPEHDLLVAVGIHPDILIELIKQVVERGCKGLIVPREDPKWLPLPLLSKLKKTCIEEGLEWAFPRPFCSMAKGNFPIINKFIDIFKIGKPRYEILVDSNEKVKEVKVLCSSPCGATFHVAAGLIGTNGEEILDIANKLWHSYPCLASSKMDPDINESPLHLAAYMNLNAAKQAIKTIKREANPC